MQVVLHLQAVDLKHSVTRLLNEQFPTSRFSRNRNDLSIAVPC